MSKTSNAVVYAKAENAELLLTPGAVEFLINLHRRFDRRRLDLLNERDVKQQLLNAGQMPQLIEHSDPYWRIAPIPADLSKRYVEITGPTDAKMVINALNSGADLFMADFEDANVPTWNNMIDGQLNLSKAVDKSLSFTNPEGKLYSLNEHIAVLMVRPRGWHLSENHFIIDEKPISGAIFDFGLFFYHNAKKLLEKGSGPYFYLAKLENHQEARLWNDLFIFAQSELGIPQGSIKATVLLETILAAFEMDLILYELREHSAGLNAGRWDYIFSVIKKFQRDSKLIFPDRGQLTMTVPFMRAYSELLVKTCHRRGAHAMGGMAAFIPNRKDKVINDAAIEKVREDKRREANDGYDGTWVAHPDLVPIAKEVFEDFLKGKPNQIERQREDVTVAAKDLLNFKIPQGYISEEGLRQNIHVGLIYLESWLRGIGAVAIDNLMEDTATAEISRAQLWQWLHHPDVELKDHRPVTFKLYQELLLDEYQKIKTLLGTEKMADSQFETAKNLLDYLVNNDRFEEFLTKFGVTNSNYVH